MKVILLSLALFGRFVFGLDLTFASGVNCTGRAEFGRRDLPSIPCYNLTNYGPTQSVIIADLSPGDNIRFFSDSDRQDELHQATANACYTEPNSRITSFKVQRNDKLEKTASTTDIVQYSVKLTNYTSLSQSIPYDIDINFSNIVSSSTYDFLIGATSIGAVVSGCVTAIGGTVPGYITCVLGVITIGNYI